MIPQGSHSRRTATGTRPRTPTIVKAAIGIQSEFSSQRSFKAAPKIAPIKYANQAKKWRAPLRNAGFANSAREPRPPRRRNGSVLSATHDDHKPISSRTGSGSCLGHTSESRAPVERAVSTAFARRRSRPRWYFPSYWRRRHGKERCSKRNRPNPPSPTKRESAALDAIHKRMILHHGLRASRTEWLESISESCEASRCKRSVLQRSLGTKIRCPFASRGGGALRFGFARGA